MIEKEYFVQRKTSIIFVVILLIIGSITYFVSGASNIADSMNTKNIPISKSTLNLFKDIELKAAYTEEGNIDMFALAKNNALSKISSSSGNSIPEVGGIVLGGVEGSMMQKEGEFKNIGDNLVDYDITFRVDGVLTKTGTFADDFHFINIEQYNNLKGESNVLLVMFKDTNTPKLFYLYDKDNPSPAKIELSDGNMNLFYKHIIGKKIYYPIIMGSKEAKMMQEEKLFTKVGDTIEGFFGKDVIIVGITKETDTGLDMMHIVEKDFFDKPLKPIEGVLV